MSTYNTTLASRKVCFVTIGATASFDSLLRATLNPTFVEVLEQHGYTDLCIQHGKDGRPILQEFVNQYTKRAGTHTVNISGFDFNKQGLGAEMRAAKGQNDSDEGVVISHAGEFFVLVVLNLYPYARCRVWLDTRRSSNRCPTDRCTESGPLRQSPG